jgi:hypothetical protein
MRTAQQWSDQWDDGDHEATKNIATIQADALRHAAEYVKSNLGKSWSICEMEKHLIDEANHLLKSPPKP